MLLWSTFVYVFAFTSINWTNWNVRYMFNQTRYMILEVYHIYQLLNYIISSWFGFRRNWYVQHYFYSLICRRPVCLKKVVLLMPPCLVWFWFWFWFLYFQLWYWYKCIFSLLDLCMFFIHWFMTSYYVVRLFHALWFMTF